MSSVKLGPEGFVEFPSLASITSGQICDIITTITVAIFLTTAISLTTYYAVHPTAPMIPLTANFSISLPLLICSVLGIALTIVLVVQLTRCSQVKLAFRKGVMETVRAAPLAQKQVTKGFYIQSRPPQQTPAQYRVEQQEKIERMEIDFGARVEFSTRDELTLGGYYYEGESDCLVIYFPTTFNLNEDHRNDYWGYLYRNLGFSVLLAGYRGYGLNEGSAGDSHQEIEAYLDAEAAWVWARKQGYANTSIIVHGREQGCVYAAALGFFCSVPNVIFENPYTTYASFIARFASMDPSTTRDVIYTSFAQGALERHPNFPETAPLVTDGFDVLNKVCQMAGAVFVFQTANDWVMPLAFGQEIVKAKYPNSPQTQEKYLSVVEGGRKNRSLFFSKPEPCQQLFSFLCDRGFYHRPPQQVNGRCFYDFIRRKPLDASSFSEGSTESEQSDYISETESGSQE